MITGKHLINGQWLNGPSTFQSQPCSGNPFTIHNASADLVGQAAKHAANAFKSYAQSDSNSRARLLRSIAKHINLSADEITKVCHQETGLPEARLIGERGRTTGQLEMFADYIEQGSYLQCSIDTALPERQPIPRPELRKMLRPMGPVVIFGASNFPLAFATAGGDTASALAAGCPVIVKGHPAHPATSEIVTKAIVDAINECDMDPGIFGLIQDSGVETAQQLVTHPAITAVGFTGSLQGGRALFDWCVQRPNPIPFYGEMGSLNPVFVMEQALKLRTESIASGWVDSLNLGVGQFCTKPGLLILPSGSTGDAFIQVAKAKLAAIKPHMLLTQGIARSFIDGIQKIKNHPGVDAIFETYSEMDAVTPNVFQTHAENWLKNQTLHEEIFGPFAIIVRTNNEQQMLEVANHLEGQLTATLLMDPADHKNALSLFHVLEHKAGRVLANGYPTGVEVAESMVHGGPYPASTFAGTTSVGTTAIQRFLRPVCYQNLPTSFLPAELQEIN